jgi:ribosomal protein S18 acetylase RimI-like enzyme
VGSPPRASRPGEAATIRDLKWSDFDDLCKAYYLLYDERDRGESHGIHLFDERPSLSDEVGWFAHLYKRVLEGEVITVVAELRGHVVGSCTIEPAAPLRASERGHVGVLGVLVHRDHRGAGIGSALLAAALERAPSKFPIVRLSVFATNVGAIQLYERFGFRTVGTIPRAFRRGSEWIDEVLMVREGEGRSDDASRPRRG